MRGSFLAAAAVVLLASGCSMHANAAATGAVLSSSSACCPSTFAAISVKRFAFVVKWFACVAMLCWKSAEGKHGAVETGDRCLASRVRNRVSATRTGPTRAVAARECICCQAVCMCCYAMHFLRCAACFWLLLACYCCCCWCCTLEPIYICCLLCQAVCIGYTALHCILLFAAVLPLPSRIVSIWTWRR